MAKRSAHPTQTARPGRYVAEVLRAVAVLALVFLNFAHTPGLAASPAEIQWQSLCGDGHVGAPERSEHRLVCHACRVDGARLPPAPALAEPFCQISVAVEFTTEPSVALASPDERPGAPRGPPAAI